MTSASATFWESKLARRLEVVAALVGILIVGRLAIQEDLSWLGWLVAGSLIVAIVVLRWPQGAIVALFVASIMPRFNLEIGNWNARPEHVAVALVAFVFAIRWLLKKQPRVALSGADYYLAAYILWNYVSSLLTSPDPKSTLRWAVLNNLVILPFYLVRFLVRDKATLRWAFKAFLAVGIAECAYGMVCFVVHQLFGTSFGVEVGQYTAGVGGVYGTHYEPNLLGSYAACTAVILLVVYFVEKEKPTWALRGAIIAIFAVLVSLSRAALVSFAFASILLTLVGVRKGFVHKRKVLFTAMLLAFVAIPVLLATRKQLTDRFTTLTAATVEDDADLMVRFAGWFLAAQDILQHPVIGNGTASFQLLADTKIAPVLGDRPWVGNSVIRIVHDTGVVGLALFALFVASIGKQVRHSIRNHISGTEIIYALSAGCLIYAITFMFTEGMMLAFFWVHAGLLASGAVLMSSDRQYPGIRTGDRSILIPS